MRNLNSQSFLILLIKILKLNTQKSFILIFLSFSNLFPLFNYNFPWWFAAIVCRCFQFIFFIAFCLWFCLRVFSYRLKKIVFASLNFSLNQTFPGIKVIIFLMLAVTFAKPFFYLQIAFLVTIYSQCFFLVLERKTKNAIVKRPLLNGFASNRLSLSKDLGIFEFGFSIWYNFLFFCLCLGFVFHLAIFSLVRLLR